MMEFQFHEVSLSANQTVTLCRKPPIMKAAVVTVSGRGCPLWVKRRHEGTSTACPHRSRKETFGDIVLYRDA